ncbi:hypothetical protein [Kitasatospora sp. NPDC006786]|uniref:hypothetical protein n=1 Tax=unclassified Kitasatospora TaxID=2633591 RepID=UPI0033CF5E52
MVTVEVHYTPPGKGDEESIRLEFQAAPGARVVLRLKDFEDGRLAVPENEERSGCWKMAARKIVASSGVDVWLRTSEIRDLLNADGIVVHRSTLSIELGAMAKRGEILRRGAGGHTEYGALLGGTSPSLPGDLPRGAIPGAAWLPQTNEAIWRAGPVGLKIADIAARIGRDRKTIRPVLQACADSGLLVYRENGPHSAYIHPDHA